MKMKDVEKNMRINDLWQLFHLWLVKAELSSFLIGSQMDDLKLEVDFLTWEIVFKLKIWVTS